MSTPDQLAYERLSATFELKKSRLEISSLSFKSGSQLGIDLSGKGSVDFVERTLEGDFELSDQKNLTHLGDLSVEIQGVRVQHLLAERGAVRLPLKLSGTLDEPRISLDRTPEQWFAVASGNLVRAAGQKIPQTLRSEVIKAIQQLKGEVEKAVSKREEKGISK
jgi:hypothetical protein